MSLREQLIECLRQLCNREGGHKPVADRAGVDDQSIYQILTGVRLPSGNPKGVGPTMQRKLDQAFPGWASAATAASATHLASGEEIASYGGAWPFKRLRYSDLANFPSEKRELLENIIVATVTGMTAPDRWRQIAHELASHMDAELARQTRPSIGLDMYTAFVLKVDALAQDLAKTAAASQHANTALED